MGLDAKNIAFEEYETVMMKTLLPKGRMLFSCGGGHAICFFQQNNDLAQRRVISHLNTCNNKHGSSVQLLGNGHSALQILTALTFCDMGCMEAKVNELG